MALGYGARWAWKKWKSEWAPSKAQQVSVWDPVHQNGDGKWYFWDETWADECGPYDTRADANDAGRNYARWLNTPKDSGICGECFDPLQDHGTFQHCASCGKIVD